jgi:hypothetical protein
MRAVSARARQALAVLSTAAGCHSAAPGNARVDEAEAPAAWAPAPLATGVAPLDASPRSPRSPPAHPQAQLTWRLFETTHSLDPSGQPRESAVFELLVNGGTPARVALGRRASLGCVVHDATEGTDGPSVVTALDCYAYAHGEYARVLRSSPGELRVEAFGQDEALPDHEPPRTGMRAATVKIQADAEIVVEPTLARVPDETPGNK